MKVFRIWTPLVLMCFLLTNCSENKNDDTSNSLPPAEQVKVMEMNYTKGEEFLMVITVDEDFEAKESPQGDWSMKNKMTMNWKMQVTSVAENGVATMKGTYERLQVFFSMPPQVEMAYDTDNEPSNPMEEEMRKAIGTGITYKVDKLGRATDMQGAENMMADMFPADSTYNGNNWMEETFNADALWTGKKANVGDTWTGKWGQRGFYPMSVANAYTLKESKDGKLTVSVEGEITPHPNSVATLEQGMNLDYSLSGKKTGEYTLRESDYRILSFNVSSEMGGTCTMRMPDGQELNFPVTITKTENSVYEY